MPLTRALGRQVPSGGAYPLAAAQLDGVNVWLLEHIASIGGASFSYASVALPEPLASSGDRGAQLAYLFSAAAPGGAFDCVLSATPLREDVLTLADALLPVETSSLTAVVPYDSPLTAAPTLAVLFAWTNPFSFEIWLLVAFSLVFGALVMYVFEGNDRYEDYGAHDLALGLRLCRGCYKAFLNFACVGGFSPNTPASQTFNVAFSFAMLLLQARCLRNCGACACSSATHSDAAHALYACLRLLTRLTWRPTLPWATRRPLRASPPTCLHSPPLGLPRAWATTRTRWRCCAPPSPPRASWRCRRA
jgi:hypothetical protein